ncbi:hypothetical protein TNCV_3498341 [Trichonephila clavipes]|nr:hypothetical protein TNCV_3498341 [Trichonephila clavipes]
MAHEIHHGKGLSDACRFHPNFEGEHPEGVQGPPIFSLSTNPTRGLAARRLFKVPPCREGTINLQTAMFSPDFENRLNGTAVSVTNHYTGWATRHYLNQRSPKW